jgi:hypothetical protein
MITESGTMLKPGDHINSWTVIQTDGARATCICKCDSVRILAVAALLDGTATPSCGCQAPTPQQRWEELEAAAEKARRKKLRDFWKPGK